jgi:KaiC/GvpD/RAD55 family RecA-like ATPase
LTALIIAEAPSDYGRLTTMVVEDYVCDLTLILRNAIDGGRRRRSIEVNKYRRTDGILTPTTPSTPTSSIRRCASLRCAARTTSRLPIA